MSLHHIVDAGSLGGAFARRAGRGGRGLVRTLGPRRGRRGLAAVDWRTVAIVAITAVLLVALLARP